MPKPEEIKLCKERYANHSDAQLIAEKHQWVEHSEMHIAAVQLLHERQQEAQSEATELSRQQHLESLSHSSRLHGKTQFVAWLAVLASVVGIFVPLWLARSSSTNSPLSTPLVQQAPTALPAASSNSVPQVATPPLAKQPAALLKP
ncbi:MAG: hypothetical protein IPK02_11530 [Candidatus Accumulibacter sp.]|uniref:Uncharacterized protein n=1 Tax=Candidatus Accumulibacter affinis TaxID=2954384 RepID=A0A935TBV9_9PROT|nr:hypothetical protein [Candidatus Accumulibacter affinis]